MDRSDQPSPQGNTLPLRLCVGIMLINPSGLVWVGRRIPKWADETSGFIWQMPQGGIAKGETPIEAALRELKEETGARSVELLHESRDWINYELPEHLIGVALKGRYRGQSQKWFAMRYLGDHREIDIAPRKKLKAEFDAWRWAEASELTELIVPFKRPAYEAVVSEFRHLVR